MQKFTDLTKQGDSPNGYFDIRDGFLVRIELHGIKNSNDYKNLRQYLKEDEFQDFFIAAGNQQRFELPRATYFYPALSMRQRQVGPSEVHKKAEEAVKAAIEAEPLKTILDNKDATIIVAKSQTIYWTGLKPYEPETGS